MPTGKCIFRPRDFLFTVWKVWKKLYQIKWRGSHSRDFFFGCDMWSMGEMDTRFSASKLHLFLRLPPLIANCCYEISPPKKCNSSTWNIPFSHFDFVRLRIPESSQFIVHSKKSKNFVWLSIDILSKKNFCP